MAVSTASRRNVMIDLGKFVYIWVIVFYHIYRDTESHFISGRFGVEFFLLAAGVFFFRGLERNLADPPRYIGRRFMRFFPWSFTAFIFAFVVIRVVINGDTSLADITERLSSDIWEALLVKMNGINNGKSFLNTPAWTLSSMFLVEIILIGCFFSCRKVFVNVLLPLSLMIGFGYWRVTESYDMEDWIGFTAFGTLRTWLVYGCAYYCTKLIGWLQKLDLTRLAEVLLTALETLCHIFAFTAMCYKVTRCWQWCTLLAFFTAIAIEMSGHSLWNRALRRLSRPIGWLSSFSLSIYLMHRPVTRYFEHLYPDTEVYYAHLLPMLAVIILCSLAQYFLVTGGMKLWRKNAKKIKALFVRS